MFWIPCLLLLLGVAECQTTVSIDDMAIYSMQRACVTNLLYWLPGNIGCNNGYNECFCRSDMTATALSYMSSRIPKDCSSNDVDLSSGIMVYTSYCNQAMGQAAAAPVTNEAVGSTSYGDTTYSTSTNYYYTPTSYATATPVGAGGNDYTGARYTGPTYAESTGGAHAQGGSVSLVLIWLWISASLGTFALCIAL